MELTRSDHPLIENLESGDNFDSFFVLRSLQMLTARNGNHYLVFDFSDKSGSIRGKMWEGVDEAYQSLEDGVVVKVRATAEEYQGQLELKVQKIRPLEESSDYSRFIPSSDRDPEEDWGRIRWAVARVTHPGLKALLDLLLADESFVTDFQHAPAGKQWHHGYIGGLLEHVASLMIMAHRMADHYPDLNRDLLVAGAFLHDVGKLWELRSDTTIDYTIRGRLLGHIVIGAEYIGRQARSIKEMDEETTTLLLHLILSHQGQYEYGSPVVPMTREAYVLYHLDEIDSKMNAMTRELTRQGGPKGPFTDYVKLLGRYLYKGTPKKDEDGGGK